MPNHRTGIRLQPAIRVVAILLICSCLLTILPIPSAQAQVETLLSLDAQSFVQIFPQLQRLPAPEWLREGTRVTYYVQTGSSSPQGNAGSGVAIVQYDLVALDDTWALSVARSYLDNGAGGVTPASNSGKAGLPASGEYWIHPAVLVSAEAAANRELAVTRWRRTDAAGVTHRVVRFQSGSAGGQFVWEFDEVSGVLVYYSNETVSPRTASRSITISTLVGQRQLQLPWQSRRIPAWVRPGVVLNYQGAQTTWISDQQVTLPANITATIQQTGRRWAVVDLGTGDPINAVRTISGFGQLNGPLWLPPEAWQARLSRGPLDRDPITGVTLALSRAANGWLLLTETGPGFELVYQYERQRGRLVAFQQTTQTGVATTTSTYQLLE